MPYRVTLLWACAAVAKAPVRAANITAFFISLAPETECKLFVYRSPRSRNGFAHSQVMRGPWTYSRFMQNASVQGRCSVKEALAKRLFEF
jgi:hypothetical protein